MPEFDPVSRKRLYRAMLDNNINALDKLVEAGYPVRSATFGDKELTALHMALNAKGISVEIVKKLISLGSDLHATTANGDIPLITAINNKYIDINVINHLMLSYGNTLSQKESDLALSAALITEYVDYSFGEVVAAIDRVNLVEDDIVEVVMLTSREEIVDYLTQEYIDQLNGVRTHIEIILPIHEIITGDSGIEAIQTLYEKNSKLDQLKTIDISLYDFSQLSYLSKSSCSDHLAMHYPFPEGDGSGGVMFNNPAIGDNDYIVTILQNGTLVIANDYFI